MWLVLTIIAMFCFAFARLLQKSVLNNVKHDPIAYSIYFQLLVALILLPVAIIDGFSFPPIQHVWLGLLLTALLYCLANISSYHALKNIPVSEFTIIIATIPLWTIITSIIFLQESTHHLKLLGILLTVTGIAIAFYSKKKLTITRYHYLALVAAICLGFAFTNDAYMLQTFKTSTYSFIYFFWPGLVLTAIYHKKVKKISIIVKDGFLKSILPSVCFAIAALSINNAYKIGGEISQIATISQASIILVIIFGFFFLHERSRIVQKLIGGSVVFLGAILVQIK